LIDVPRVVVIANEMVKYFDFFCIGTDDLTQFGLGYSMDDAEAGFLPAFSDRGIFPTSPFAAIDVEGIGQLLQIACKRLKEAKPDVEIGMCGSHVADPESVMFAARLGISYLSCSPCYVPIAKMAAAQAVANSKHTK
jgi:pyruvate,orthophosphate dikinase